METSNRSPQRAGPLTWETTRFGQLTVAEEQIITLAGGLLGFPGYTRYVIVSQEEGVPFRWLQSVEHPALAFVIIDPWGFKPDYALELPAEVCASLQLSEDQPPLVFAIVTVPLDPSGITANLQGPLVINLVTRQGQQVVLTHSPYTTRHVILGDLWRARDGDNGASNGIHHSAV